MRVRVKICGLRTAADVDAAVDAGADAVGFVFAESPRRVMPEEAGALAQRVPPGVARVGVFLHPPSDLVAHVAQTVPLDWLQSDTEDGPAIAAAAPRASFLPVFRDGADLHGRVARLVSRADDGSRTVLVESPRSGAGMRPDWGRIAALPRTFRVILAGGLTPENVGEAIRRVRPFAVDVSSGVESSPGVKDPAQIGAFVRAVRAAEAEAGPAHSWKEAP